jgi:hypothetical protein
MLKCVQFYNDTNHIEINELLDPNNGENRRDESKIQLFIAKYRQLITQFASGVSCTLISYALLCSMESTSTPFIQNQANAWSSVCYALVAAPPLVRIPLFVLSVMSFCLWAHSTNLNNYVDVSCIYWVIIAVTIHMLPSAPHNRVVLIFLDTAFIIVLFSMSFLHHSVEILDYYHSNLVPITGIIYSLCGIVICSFYMTNKKFILGSMCISVGFICKLLTIYQGQYWGTATFHTLSAIGIQILLTIDKQ